MAPEGEQPRVLEALKSLLEQDLGFLPAVLEAAANMHLDRDLQVGPGDLQGGGPGQDQQRCCCLACCCMLAVSALTITAWCRQARSAAMCAMLIWHQHARH